MSSHSSAFGYSFNLEECSEAEISHLMSLVKKAVNTCRRKVTRSIHSIADSCHEDTPDQVYKFLQYIKFTCEKGFTGNRLLCKFLLDEVKKLLLFTGRIWNSSNEYILQEADRNANSAEGTLVQVTARIWTEAASIFLTAEEKQLHPSDPLILQCDRCLGTIGKQVSYILLDDLIHIAAVRFTRFVSSSDLTVVNPFANAALECAFHSLSGTLAKYEIDTWTIVVELVKQNTATRDPKTGHCPPSSLPPHPSPPPQPPALSIRYFSLNSSSQVASGRELFVLWLMSSFHQVPVQSSLITNLVKAFVAREVPFLDSPSLKASLMQSSKLLMNRCTMSKQPSCVEVTFPLLEVLIRRLNMEDGFQSSSIPPNGHEWLLLLKKPSNQQSRVNESLFPSLLSLLAAVIDSLQHGPNNETNSQQLTRLKGRLVSKIQPRRLQELDELGTFKFLSFFLALAIWRKDQWNEMTDRICEISQKILEVKSGNSWNAKVSTTVKAMFTLLHSMPSEVSTPSKLKQLLCHSIPHLPPGSRHPLASALFLSGKVNTSVVEIVFHVMRQNYLSKFQSESSCKVVLQFILQMHSTSKSNVLLHSKVKEEMRQLLDCLLERTLRLDESEMPLMQEVVRCIVSDTREDTPSTVREVIFGVVEAFASSFLESAPNSMLGKIFRALEVFIGACPELTSGTETVFGVLNRVIEGIEAKRMMGSEVLMRKFLNELLRKCSK